MQHRRDRPVQMPPFSSAISKISEAEPELVRKLQPISFNQTRFSVGRHLCAA